MYTLSKKFRFESAHRLAKGYEGKCANIHGHSWNGELTVECPETDDLGFAIDFAELKVFTKMIESRLDHAIFLCSDDDKLIVLCTSNNWKTFISDDNPTSEIIARDIYKMACDHFLGKVFVKSVTIEETCTSRCVYSTT